MGIAVQTNAAKPAEIERLFAEASFVPTPACWPTVVIVPDSEPRRTERLPSFASQGFRRQVTSLQ
jgi:hypothetical protein